MVENITKIPEDLDQVLFEIDNDLIADGVPPAGRPLSAISAFSKKFQISLPASPGTTMRAGRELFEGGKYTDRIYAWYRVKYGDRLGVDASAGRVVVVLADGDLWELALPQFFGTMRIFVGRSLSTDHSSVVIGRGGVDHNACDSLRGITEFRLNQFSDDDLKAVFDQFVTGMDCCAAISQNAPKNHFFNQCTGDLLTAVQNLTAQTHNYGQSRYASHMLLERFMKGKLVELGFGTPDKIHKLRELNSELSSRTRRLNIEPLLQQVDCKPSVRYGEEVSTREQAYIAHKSSIEAVVALSKLT